MNYKDLQDNVADDKIEKEKQTDPRRPKLTLKHLHKLRKIRELKELELTNQSRQLELIYAQPVEPTGGI